MQESVALNESLFYENRYKQVRVQYEAALTQEVKIEDFYILYNTIKENYLMLEANKRLNGIDWLNNYDKYEAAVRETKNDTEFMEIIYAVFLS